MEKCTCGSLLGVVVRGTVSHIHHYHTVVKVWTITLCMWMSKHCPRTHAYIERWHWQSIFCVHAVSFPCIRTSWLRCQPLTVNYVIVAPISDVHLAYISAPVPPAHAVPPPDFLAHTSRWWGPQDTSFFSNGFGSAFAVIKKLCEHAERKKSKSWMSRHVMW